MRKSKALSRKKNILLVASSVFTHASAYREIYDYFRKFDPLHKNEEGIFNTLGYIDVVHLADRIRGETLFAISLCDDVTPPSTCFAAYNHINAKKELFIYPDFSHEALPGFYDTVLQKFQQKFVVQ